MADDGMKETETRLEVRRLTGALEEDFYRYHGRKSEGWCYCVAWIVPSWVGWSDRTAEENRAVRGLQFLDDKHDGYLLYLDDEPVGWCQVAPVGWFPKLAAQADDSQNGDSQPDYAISCFSLAPQLRGQGLAHLLLSEVLDDLAARGVKRVQAFPRCGKGLADGEVWTGPEPLYRKAGFAVARDDGERPVLVKEL